MFIENGMKLLSSVPYRAVAMASLLKKSSKVKDGVVDKHVYVDHEKVFKYYQFKRRTGVEKDRLWQSSAYRESGRQWQPSYMNLSTAIRII